MFFNKKKKQKEITPRPEVIRTYRYTYPIWQKEYPNKSKLDYEATIIPDNLLDFLYKLAEITSQDKIDKNGNLPITNDMKFSVIPIDDNYYKWLDDNKRIDNVLTKNEYCQKLDDGTIYKLMKENGWTEEYSVVGIPIYMINTGMKEIKKTNFKLEKELKENLITYLENIYGEDNIFLPGYILTQNDFFNGERDFVQLAKLHFQQNTNVRFIKFEEQIYQNKNALIYPYVLPFAIKRTYDSALLNLFDLLQDIKFTPMLSLTSEGLKRYNIELENFKDTPMFSEIRNMFGDETILMESVVRCKDIPAVNRSILSKIIK